MPIQMKLGRYEADEEASDALPIGRKAALVLGVLSVLPVLFVFIWGTGGAEETRALLAKPSTAGGRTAGSEADATVDRARRSVFASTNWEHLERGAVRPPPKSLDTDQECPEWEGRDVYRELKAMAVYEVKEEPKAEPEAVTPELLRSLSEERK